MASRTMQQKLEDIRQLLEVEKVKTIALEGNAGVGKTWMAAQFNDYINNDIDKSFFYGTLWISMNKKYDDSSLYEVIARQLSVHSSTQEDEDDVEKEEATQEKEKMKELGNKIPAKLKEMLNAKIRGVGSFEHKAFLLLITLDDIRTESDEGKITSKLQALLQTEPESSLKFLITRRNKASGKGIENGEEIVTIGPLSKEESGTLFQKRIGETGSNWDLFRASIEVIAEKSKGLPAAVVILVAEALNQSGAHDSGVSKLESALKEAASYEEADKCIRSLMWYAICMLQNGDMSWTPGNDAVDMALVNCYWHSWEFFRTHGAIDYNELILSWILEGYVGSADHVKEAYEAGHRVLMKLIDRGVLKMQEDNLVMMEALALTVHDSRRVGYEQRSSLGLASVLEDEIWKGFGILTPTDGMMKTPTSRLRWNNVSTLLIGGCRLGREVPDIFFQPMVGLQNLAIFNPSFKKLPPSLSQMEKLCMLVLRGCDRLQNVDDIRQLKSLTVLEISDASFLEKITDDFFKQMINLRSLNFSAVPIKSLPSSLSNLSELRWLILRKCSFLESLPKLKALENLEVLDLSGATSLKTIRDKKLSWLPKLKLLDFSHTQIKRLPILGKLKNLSRLLLRGCKLTRLPFLKSLPTLQYLDLSASNMLKEIKDDFSKNKDKLKILDLSKTEISRLPSNFGDLRNLEVLDLSDASKLVEIPESAFTEMRSLRHLNLSNTKLERLPSISNLGNLRQLFLRRCSLKKLPKMEGLTRLEELDLSNASEIEDKTEAEFLERMIHLKFLNLSGTRLKLPSMSNLTNLIRLSLRGCSLSESEPNLGEYKKLEVLDLSETTISSLSSLNNLRSLRELKLRSCSKLEQLQHLESLIHLEVLDLWGTGITKFPHEIYELTRLKHLDLPEGIQELDWGKIKHLPEKLNWDGCAIFEHWENFKEFHFSVCPRKEQGRAADIRWHKVDLIFRKIYIQTRSFPKVYGRYLEILGFDCFPAGVEDALMKAEYVSLVGNKSIIRLSDLGVGNVKAMKGCWLQRCTEMETISSGKETEGRIEENLEILWASNLPKLKCVYSGIMEGGRFKNLTKMYLDCCPMLKYVFPSSQFPEKLESLQINFCDDLERLFETNVLEEHKQWNLQRLHLVELPKLTGMGVPESKSIWNIFPKLEVIKVKECPKLETLADMLKKKEKIEKAGGFVENSNDIDDYDYGESVISTDF